MGQEASLPEDPDFEEQAKAPPSSINPPSSLPASQANVHRVGHGSAVNRGQKLMGVFRANHDFEGKESARNTVPGGNHYFEPDSTAEKNTHRGVNGYGSNVPLEPSATPNAAHSQPEPWQLQTHESSQPFNSSFQTMIQQQPLGVSHQAASLQQQHLQVNYSQDGLPDSLFSTAQDGHNETPPIYQSGVDTQQSSNQPVTVGVMFEKVPPERVSKRGGGILSGRAHARGAALINSMRNLSLGGALSRAGTHKNQSQGKGQQGANEWEKQWDEDDDSDDDEEEPTSAIHPLHQARPGMDIGHSSSGAIHLNSHIQPEALQQQGVKGGFSPTPHPGHALPQQVSPPSPITFDSEPPVPSFSAAVAQAPDLLSDEHPGSLSSDWDSSSYRVVTPLEETVKPNVMMFLPMLRVLGKGSFGKVVLVQKRVGKERGQLFAMKILRKTHLVKRRQIERTRTERKVLSVVNHPFIMKLHYAFQTDDKLYLVLDYCPGGELFFHLSRFRRFPERVSRFYAAELLLAIGHLHKRGIIYRDLKPENVLLDAEGHVKLGDFGLAKAGIKHPYEGAASMCGTPEYMAPEVLAQQGHGFCVDYWGLGMLTYEMMTGLPPWYTTDRAKLFRRLKSAPLDIPTYFSAASADCVSALLERNPRRRLGATGVRAPMEHEFFRNISWRSLYARRVEAPIRPCEGWKAPEAIHDEDNSSLSPNQLSSTSHTTPVEIGKLEAHDLEAATQNFDNTFTRMPVESEDAGDLHEEDAAASEELDHETFLGFSFDGRDSRDFVGMTPTSSSPARQRSPNHQSHQIE